MMQEMDGSSEMVDFGGNCEADNCVASNSCQEKLNSNLQQHNDDYKDAWSNGHCKDVEEEAGPSVKSVHGPSTETSASTADLSTPENVTSLADPSIQENAISVADPSREESMTSMNDLSFQAVASMAGPSTQDVASIADPSSISTAEHSIKEGAKSTTDLSIIGNEDRVVDSSGESQGHQGFQDESNDDEPKERFSEALPYSGMLAYSAQTPRSGSTSFRSDSSASTRSFAFPIMPSDWNFSSPRKIGPPDMSFYKRRRRWRRACCCWCKEPSTFA